MDLYVQKVPKWIKVVKKKSVSCKPHQLITRGPQLVWGFRGHWNNQEVKACRPVLNVTWMDVRCAWLVTEEVFSVENRSVWLILHGEGIVSLPLTPHAHAVHVINYVTLPFNRFIFLPHTQLEQRSNRVHHPPLFFSHHLPENAEENVAWQCKDSVSFFTSASLQTFCGILRSNVHTWKVFSEPCRHTTVSRTILHHAVSLCIRRSFELCLCWMPQPFFFFLFAKRLFL